jgi:hypothetical protein
MKTISQTLNVGKDVVELHMKVGLVTKLGIKPIFEKKCDSFVGQFARVLHGLMSGQYVDVYSVDANVNYATRYHAETPVRLTKYIGGVQQSTFDIDGDLYVINGHEGLHELSGIYAEGVTGTTSANLTLASIVSDGDWTWARNANLAPLTSYPSSIVDDSLRINIVELQRATNIRPQEHWLGDPQIIVGKGEIQSDLSYSSPATSYKDPWIRGPLFVASSGAYTIEYSGTTVSPPAVGTNSSKIVISRTVTNSSGSSIPIRDVGLVAQVRAVGHRSLIGRDSVSFSIANGASVVVSYEITVSSTSTGGIMSQFNELLYRHFAQGNREVKDITNSNRLHPENDYTFRCCGPGGNNIPYAPVAADDVIGKYTGPVLGSGSEAVSNTNFFLNTVIPHGDTNGTLFYYGSIVSDFKIDSGADKVYWDVERIVENRGATTVTVNETCLNCMAAAGVSDQVPAHLFMIARHNISASPVAIAAGEFARIRYRWEIPS